MGLFNGATSGNLSSEDRSNLAREIGLNFSMAAEIRRTERSLRPGERRRIRVENVARLRIIHAKALGDHRTRDAAEFFLTDIYPEETPPWRDSQALKAIPSLAKLLPENALLALSAAALLDRLTEEADAKMAQAGLRASYEEAYAMAGQALRERQIAALVDAGRALSSLASSSMAKPALIAMRIPARLGGFGDLQSFLERGLAAFEQLQEPAEFAKNLAQDELAEMRRILALAAQ